jgi:cell division initiation protein
MSINSEVIQKKEFHVVFKGYKPEEVDKFLDILAVEFEKLQRTNRELQDSVDKVKYEENKESAEMKKVIQEALVSAHKIAEDIKMKAEKEAEEIVKNKVAEEEGSYKELLKRKMQLEREIEELEMEYRGFKEKIAKLVDDFKEATSGLGENKFIRRPQTGEEDDSFKESRASADLEVEEKEEEKLAYLKGDRSPVPEIEKEVIEEEEEPEEEALMEGRTDRYSGGEEEAGKEGLEKEESFEKIEFEEQLSKEEPEEEYLKRSKFREYFNEEEEYKIGQESKQKEGAGEESEEVEEKGEERIEEEEQEEEEKPERGIYDDSGELEETEDYYKPKRMKKKIDIANPDIINDFFKSDED